MPEKRPTSIEILARGLVESDGRILVCQNIKHKHVFLPGGHVEPGEGAPFALAREFEEENGERIRVGPLLLVAESSFVQRGRPKHELNLVFHVEHTAGAWPAEAQSREPHIRFAWLGRDDIQERLLPHDVGAWVAAWASEREGRHPSADWLSDMD